MRDDRQPATVLNVDDNDATLYLRSRILQSAGWNVLEAQTGNDALRLVAAEHPEVALLDINLPDISGIEVCRVIKDDPATASTLVIQISAKHIEPQDRLNSLESGADTYLTHPVEPDVLIATVQALLRLRRTLQETRTALQFSHDILAVANRHTEMDALLSECAQTLKNLVGCDTAGIWITGDGGSVLHGGCEGYSRQLLSHPVDRMSEETISRACLELGCRAMLFIPVRTGELDLGFIHIADARRDRFAPDTLYLVKTAASHIAPAIRRLRAEAALVRTHGELEQRVCERTAELAKVNQELDAERSRLFSILNALPLFVSLHGSDYSIRFANSVFCETFGDHSGRRCYEVIAGRDTPCGDCASKQVFETGGRIQREWTAPNGSHYQVYHLPFQQEAGDEMVMELGVDITERKSMEQEVHGERNKLKQILDSLPDGICLINRRQEIEYVNPALENDYGRVTGECTVDTYFQDSSAIFPGVQGSLDRSDWYSVRTKKNYEVTDTPVTAADGSVGRLRMFHDVTSQKKVEEALKRSEAELRVLSGRLLTAHETERSRISRELHDELGQALTLLKLRLGSMSKELREDQTGLRAECGTTLSYLDHVIESVRALSRELSPSVLEDLGLVAGLRQLIHGFSDRSGIRITAELDPVDSLIPKGSHILVYRVVQEALTNVARHSGAANVCISLKSTSRAVRCSVSDDGRGMKMKPRITANGLGMRIMRERVNMLGGTLRVSSRAGRGTSIRFSVPLERSADEEDSHRTRR